LAWTEFIMTDKEPKKRWAKKITFTICIGLLIAFFKFAILGQTETQHYENGQKAVERTFNINGDITSSIHWYENGQKKEETKWKDSKADGAFAEWYSSGQKKIEGIYKRGIPYKADVWKPNGERCLETNIRNGSGARIDYYENGDKKSKQVWSEEKQHGEWIEWKIKGSDWLSVNPREIYGATKENGYTKFRETYKDGKSVSRAIWREKTGKWESY